ncbi:hypothetical protein NLI96_g9678 [Meripilus lineatus]|uniref:Uncharacterized protein n=1 Tax=Meripilus lineatus TaxID=2056292 RepID=A0AAD5Y9Y7_9APHY|nr:hypothetical protein NLI96_g9678 [Physisporinus lineatus]
MVAGPPPRQFSSHQPTPSAQAPYISFYPAPTPDPSWNTSVSRRGYRPGQLFASSFRGGRANTGSSSQQTSTPLRSRIDDGAPDQRPLRSRIDEQPIQPTLDEQSGIQPRPRPEVPQYLIDAGLTSIALINAAFIRQQRTAETRTTEDIEFVNLMGSINNEAARTPTLDRHPLVAHFVKRYSGKPQWMRTGPSTSVKKRRARDHALMTRNEEMDGSRGTPQTSRRESTSGGPQGSTQLGEDNGPRGSTQPTNDESPTIENPAESMDETPDGVATMPPFNLQHMDRWVGYLRRENRVDVPGFT